MTPILFSAKYAEEPAESRKTRQDARDLLEDEAISEYLMLNGTGRVRNAPTKCYSKKKKKFAGHHTGNQGKRGKGRK